MKNLATLLSARFKNGRRFRAKNKSKKGISNQNEM
jgi:hypothetical protein